ncbi:MAG: hypothetical protein ABEI54_05285 [Candidatus Bipolaricaulia bacterium]
MPKYEVTLSKAIGITVEADSEEEAMKEAVACDGSGDLIDDWNDAETIATDCQEVENED